MIYAAIYKNDNVVEGVAGIPEDQLSTYHPGEGYNMEIIESMEQVPLEKMAPGKVIRRVGPQRYELQDI
jgi:hypothetical protein